MLEQTLGDILKATATGVIVLSALIGIAYIGVRVRERYLKGHALATEIIMQAVKPISIGGHVGVVKGAYSSKEAIIEWVDEFDSDGDGVPDSEDESPELDDRHRLLVELCRYTLADEKYKVKLGQLMTADDAQRMGGHFADRNRWQQAIDYGKGNHLIYTQNDGTFVDRQECQGAGVSDLLAKLAQINPILKSAINALPTNGKK